MIRRRRFKQSPSLQDRLNEWAEKVREQADRLAPGPERKALLQKASRADTASHMDNWLNSPGLRPPR